VGDVNSSLGGWVSTVNEWVEPSSPSVSLPRRVIGMVRRRRPVRERFTAVVPAGTPKSDVATSESKVQSNL
jgi:hypothetical protein